MDICACLITLLQDHPDLSSLILELGFVSKLRENLEASHATPAVYELSLLVLCAILRGNSILHRTVVLKLGSRHHTSHNANHNASHNCGSHVSSHSNSHMNSGGSSVTAQASASSIFTTTTNNTGFGAGMDTSASYGGGFFNDAPPVEEVSFPKPTSYQPGKLFFDTTSGKICKSAQPPVLYSFILIFSSFLTTLLHLPFLFFFPTQATS